MAKNTLLAIVPARGGSKRIPLKNLRTVAEKPLIRYTIEAARKSLFIDRLLVSTDHPKIRDISLSAGAEVPFIRPSELAGDQASTVDVVLHAVSFLKETEGKSYDFFVVLQPTSPFRTTEDIDGAFEVLQQSTADSLVSVSDRPVKVEELYIMKDNYIEPLFLKDPPGRKSEFYRVNGALYMGRTDALCRDGKLPGGTVLPYPMSEYHSLDIDYFEDLRYAELLVEGGLAP